ncbi:hypothetical protein V3N99_08240 [Dermatophilaceae bacterium Soc4.6]
MPNQTVRQQARRAALDAQSRARQRRAEQDRRRSALAITVVTALAERDAHVLACEARAGQALRALTEVEGLPVREAVEWCGDGVTRREAARLRTLGQPQTGAETSETSETSEPAGSTGSTGSTGSAGWARPARTADAAKLRSGPPASAAAVQR